MFLPKNNSQFYQKKKKKKKKEKEKEEEEEEEEKEQEEGEKVNNWSDKCLSVKVRDQSDDALHFTIVDIIK